MRLSLLTLLLSFSSFAADSCFQVQVPESPFSVDSLQTFSENWCERRFVQEGTEFRLSYNVDSGIRPELTFLEKLSKTGESEKVAHGFRSKGKISYSISKSSEFNPLPEFLRVEKRKPLKLKLVEEQEMRLQDLKETLLGVISDKSRSYRSIRIRPGVVRAYLDPSAQPYRGYWYPMAKRGMIRNSSSPLYVFDRLVPEVIPGLSPNAAGWERRHHVSRKGWAGHCNGWAAASILAEEPTQTLIEPNTGTLISPSTQKAWQTEAHFCVHYSFYGSRYEDRSDDLEDISPERFHKLLIHYIKNQKRPIAIDITNDKPVYNHVISGFTSTVKKRGSRKYDITTKARVHSYDKSITDTPGIARRYTQTYKYRIRLDRDGRIRSGRWLSDNNPDFVWVPLAPKNCGGQNPHVTHEAVDELLRLPLAD